MELNGASSASTAPVIPVWGIVVSGLAVVAYVAIHWRFRTGWSLSSDTLLARPVKRYLVIDLGFTALPGVFGTAAMTGLLLIGRIWRGSHSWVVGYTIVGLGLVLLGSGVWFVKEFFRPTKRRTPDWLKHD
ncbi:MAG: hypothetical protein JWR83_3085 [Aeromicrobium sp.]|nr:hypothetical protein [Aeromicrobium sp.]